MTTSETSNQDAHLGAVTPFVGPRIRQAMAAYAVGRTVWVAAKQVHSWMKTRSSYTVTVPGSDPIYGDLHVWLLNNMAEVDRRATVAKTHSGGGSKGGGTSDSSDRPNPQPHRDALKLFYDGGKVQEVAIRGHKVQVFVESFGGGASTQEDDPVIRRWIAQQEKMNFYTYSIEARDAVVDFLRDRAVEQLSKDRRPSFLAARVYGWERRQELPSRPLESVVLREGQREELVADIEQFLSHEQDYVRLGQPWHRGYLLQGPPGTGKTSIAKAIADHFRFDVHYLPLSDVKGDMDLINLVSSISPRSMLLIEDIDIAHAATSRDDEGGAKAGTLSGLLNSLDGVATPHGLITVMTSNYPERLDPALVRGGRVDRTFDIGYLTDEQLGRMVEVATGRRCSLPSMADPLSPSVVSDVLKANIGNPDAAIAALRCLIRPGAHHPEGALSA